MTNLAIKYFTQDAYSSGTQYAFLNYIAVDYYQQPFNSTLIQLGAVQDLMTAPPTYTSIAAAKADIESAKATDVLNQVNTIAGTTLYSGYTVQAIDTAVGAAIMSLATVAKTGNYSDLNGLPSITSAKAYEGTTLRTGAFPIFKSGTVSGGTVVFHFTNDGTSSGTALFSNGIIADSVNPIVSDAAASYQMSWAFSNSNKTLTVTANKLTTANILTGILGQSAANSAVVKVSVWGF